MAASDDSQDWTDRLQIDPRLSHAGIAVSRPLLTKRVNEYDQHIVDVGVILQIDGGSWPEGLGRAELVFDLERPFGEP